MTAAHSSRITVIVNGAAGGGRCGKKASQALEELRSGTDAELHILETGKPGDGTLLARQAWLEGDRHFWCLGGDGTLFEVINGLLPNNGEERPRIGMLPLGTGNSFLRDFDIHDTTRARAALLRDKPRRVDVIRLEHDDGDLYFINLCSIGFSATVGTMTNRWFKPLGSHGYNVSVLLCLMGLSHPVFPLCMDEEPVDERPCTMISFCNSRFTGGAMLMAPEADTGDGAMDVIRLGRIGRLGLLSAFPKIFKGSHVKMTQVESARAKRVVFDKPEEMDVLLDGEVFHIVPRALEVIPGALDVST